MQNKQYFKLKTVSCVIDNIIFSVFNLFALDIFEMFRYQGVFIDIIPSDSFVFLNNETL